MLRLFRRRIRKLKLLLCLLLVLAAIFCYTRLRTHKRKKLPTPLPHFQRSLFQLQQNGDYWIHNNFIRAPTHYMVHGNASLTLTTHGTYRELGLLEWLLPRWEAPISLAIYVHDSDDFERTLHSFHYIRYCTVVSMSFFKWASVQLIFHDRHLPLQMPTLGRRRPQDMRCQAPYARGNQPVHMANYPLHLLRNVARLNANTYFVFPLDMDMLPTRHFVGQFLDFVQQQRPMQPLKSIYCVPIIAQLNDDDGTLPKSKTDLLDYVFQHGNGTQAAMLHQLRSWLAKDAHQGELSIFELSKKPQKCAAYVSINAYEPLYDQRYSEPGNDMHLQVLTGLDFDFIVLDGTFLIRRHTTGLQQVPSRQPSSLPQRRRHIHELIKFNALTLWNDPTASIGQ